MDTTTLPLWLDLLLSALLVIGCFFAVVGSWGLAKLSTFLKRLHGPTKATTLGVGCVLIASAVYFTLKDQGISVHELMITLFLFLTAPVSAQLMIKAAIKVDPAIAPAPPAERADVGAPSIDGSRERTGAPAQRKDAAARRTGVPHERTDAPGEAG